MTWVRPPLTNSKMTDMTVLFLHVAPQPHPPMPASEIKQTLLSTMASLIAQLVKNLPAMQETLVQFLGWEDPLEKEMATHSSILAWDIP